MIGSLLRDGYRGAVVLATLFRQAGDCERLTIAQLDVVRRGGVTRLECGSPRA